MTPPPPLTSPKPSITGNPGLSPLWTRGRAVPHRAPRARVNARGCHKDAHPFFLIFFLLWHPLSDVVETPDPEVP